MSSSAESKRASSGGVTVGSYVDAACGKCKDVTSHIVLAKIGAVPTRVECRTCHAMHAYRLPGASRASGSGRSAPAPRARPAADPAQVWAEIMRKAEGAAVRYSPDRLYAVGTRVSHPTFGEGVVVRHTSTTVCEVVFRDRAIKLKMGSITG
jgi:hypothetical protein